MKENGLLTGFLFGFAALSLGQALQNNGGFMSAEGMVLLTIALIFLGLAVLSMKISLPPVAPRVLIFVLYIGLAWQLIQLLTSQPTLFIPDTFSKLWPFKAIVGLGAVTALLSITPKVWSHRQLRRAAILMTFLSIFAAGVWVIRSSPDPHIDVYMFHETSSKALISGHNPYELTEPLFYSDATLYGPELVKDGRMTIGNPYPPLSIYLALLGEVVGGDVRYSLLAAILLTAVIIASIGSNRYSLLAAYIFLFTPRLFFILDLSWTEPFVLLFAVAVVWCAIYRPSWTFIVFGLLIASKQYMLLMVPLMILLIPTTASLGFWIKACAQTLAVAFLVTAPLAFWNFQAFIWNVLSAQFYQPFRPEALSYAVIYNNVTGHILPFYMPFIFLGVALLWVLRFIRRSPLGFSASLALCLAVFFATNKQAFGNYYFLVFGMLCCSLAITFVDILKEKPEALGAQLIPGPAN